MNEFDKEGHNVAVGSPKPPKGNRITDGTQNSSIGEK